MGEFPAVTCDSCGEPMVPNVSTLDDYGCGWICLNPGCPELAAGELEAEDLVEAGVPEALAGRLARLVDHYADAEEARGLEDAAPARARERAQAELARLRALVLEVGRLAEGAGALAAHLSDSLVVSYHSDDFAEAQDARQALAAVGALCVVLRRTACRRAGLARRRRPGTTRAAGPGRVLTGRSSPSSTSRGDRHSGAWALGVASYRHDSFGDPSGHSLSLGRNALRGTGSNDYHS